MSPTIRLGIIGAGNMGTAHARSLQQGRVQGLALGALCDEDSARFAPFPGVPSFADPAAMVASGTVDAVLIATPHYSHVPLSKLALEAGLHVLVEKPIAVHKAAAEELLAARRANPGPVFAAMFNQRTDPRYRKVRDLIRAGELGTIKRASWIITNWFRTDAYYASGGWRATWAGEGGGVLLNQCPHQLDLWWWLFGAPSRVRAFCSFGKYHKIEVEDDVTAVLEYEGGMTGHFITSTGEFPGSNRLEISGDRGRLIVEGDKVTWTRTVMPVSEWCRTTSKGFSGPDTWEVSIPTEGTGGQHVEIMQNFADAILRGTPLLAPAEEGIHSVELANAMLYSSFVDGTVSYPLDAAAYAKELERRIATSTYRKPAPKAPVSGDFARSFA